MQEGSDQGLQPGALQAEVSQPQWSQAGGVWLQAKESLSKDGG